jgi:hypothetical protein
MFVRAMAHMKKYRTYDFFVDFIARNTDNISTAKPVFCCCEVVT